MLYYHALSRFFSTFAFQLLSFFAFLEVFEETRSPLNMAVVGLALYIPTFLLNFWGGVIVDRLTYKGRFYLIVNVLQIIVPVNLLLIGSNSVGVLFSVFIISILRSVRSPLYYSVLSQIKETGKDYKPGYLAKINTLSWQIPLILSPVLVSFLPVVLKSPNAVLFLIIGFQVLASLLAIKAAKVCSKKIVKSKLTSLFSFYREQAKNKREVFIPLFVDSLLACFLGLNSFLPFLLDGHGLDSQYFGLTKSIYHLASIVLIVLFPINGFKDSSLKNISKFLFLWGGTILFIGFADSVLYLGVGIVVLGLLDGLSIIYRESLIFKFTPAEEMGRVSSANSFLVSTGDEFGEFSTGVMLGGIGLNMHVVLNFVLSILTGGYVFYISGPDKEKEILINNEESLLKTR